MTALPAGPFPSKPWHCAALAEPWGAVSATQAETPACHRPRPRATRPISTWHGVSSFLFYPIDDDPDFLATVGTLQIMGVAEWSGSGLPGLPDLPDKLRAGI